MAHIGTYWHIGTLQSIEVDINIMQSREGGQKKGPDESKTVSGFLCLSSPGFHQFGVLLLSSTDDTQIKTWQRYSVIKCLILITRNQEVDLYGWRHSKSGPV